MATPSDNEPEQPKQRVADDIAEEYSANFSVAVSKQEVMIFFGNPVTTFDEEGNIRIDEIEYHSKMQMSHESARQLRDLLDEYLGEGAEAR